MVGKLDINRIFEQLRSTRYRKCRVFVHLSLFENANIKSIYEINVYVTIRKITITNKMFCSEINRQIEQLIETYSDYYKIDKSTINGKYKLIEYDDGYKYSNYPKFLQTVK